MSITPIPMEDPLVPSLGERLYISRTRAGFTEAQAFAKHLGISRASVANYERGRTTPLPVVLRAWAAAVGLSLAELTGDLEYDPRPSGGGSVNGLSVSAWTNSRPDMSDVLRLAA